MSIIKNIQINKRLISLIVILLLSFTKQSGFTQNSLGGGDPFFSLDECITYALTHGADVKTTRLDYAIAKARTKQLTGIGLPQITAKFDFAYYPIIATSLLDAANFPGDPNGPPIPQGTLVEAQFGLPFQSSVGLEVSQLLIDGSFFVGLKAAKVYNDLVYKRVQQSEIESSSKVMKAYYTAIVGQKSLGLLDANIERVAKLRDNTKALHEQGFAEKIDVDRLEISVTNLEMERNKTERIADLGMDLLKFQMGMDLNREIILTDTIPEEYALPPLEEFVDETEIFHNRIEYNVLSTNKNLQLLNAKRIKYKALPSLVAFGDISMTAYSDKFDLYKINNRAFPWYSSSVVGLAMRTPLFTGGQRKYEARQSTLEAAKIDIMMENFENAVKLQVRNARANVLNAYNTLETYDRNYKLAQEVFRVAQIKYEEGVGSNLEVTNAEQTLQESQTFYLTTLYEYILARINLKLAKGEILPSTPLTEKSK